MAETPTTFAGVVFDLDGTLIDSSEDIAAAMNAALGAHGGRPLAVSQVAAVLGGGPRALVAQCAELAGLTVGDDELRDILGEYSANYAAAPAARTRLIGSAGAVLEKLHQRDIAIGICTNKRTALAETVLDLLGVRPFIAAVVGSDTAARPKPDPRHLTDTCRAIDVPVTAVLYVGDTEIDRAAATAANAAYAHVRWGRPDIAADFHLASFDDLLAIV